MPPAFADISVWPGTPAAAAGAALPPALAVMPDWTGVPTEGAAPAGGAGAAFPRELPFIPGWPDALSPIAAASVEFEPLVFADPGTACVTAIGAVEIGGFADWSMRFLSPSSDAVNAAGSTAVPAAFTMTSVFGVHEV